MDEKLTVALGESLYEVERPWGLDGAAFRGGRVTDVTVDAADRVHVLVRHDRYVDAWRSRSVSRISPRGPTVRGEDPTVDQIPNGIPGVETRLSILWSEDVAQGRITPQQFVALTSTNAAKTFGLHTRKGTVAIWIGRGPRRLGSDAHRTRDQRRAAPRRRLHPV